MNTSQAITADHGSAGAPMVSAERALVSDARLALAVVNEVRYPVLRRVFGVPREEANLLTFVLMLSAARTTYRVARRIVRHPWPLNGPDTAIAGFLVRELGFGIAGPKARELQMFGTLIAIAAVGGLTLPGLRRALHSLRIAEQRVGQQRMRIYGAAQRQARQVRAAA